MNNDTVLFYTNPMSRGRMVHWMLEETGAPYEVSLVDFNKKEHKSPEFLKINPMGKLPAIVHRGTAVTECAAIMSYLADAFPKNHLAPPTDSPLRGSYYRWLFFGAGCIDPALIDKMTNRPACEKPQASGYGTFDDVLNTLEGAVKKGPYLLGDNFTAADLYLAAQIGWGTAFGGMEKRPAFMAYLERCTSRPASKRAEEKSKELEARLKQSS